VVFERLHLWIDPLERPGPEAMAVDEWLLENATLPVLRVYRWRGEWGSVGYFGKLAEARHSFPGISWVRRWTGGGTVDHRADWTYTVVAPAGENVARLRGAESYRAIHAALAAALAGEGIRASLSTGAGETGATACFENPVGHDLVDAGQRKIAGAGQRRSSSGLLHQGSLALPCEAEVSGKRAVSLASELADQWELRSFDPPGEILALKVRERYALEEWTKRR
jgi:lipoyl(octanoyl) transferase